jgi:hypothetical protein
MEELVENIESIKRKIKKLFALSASSNPSEAAAALEKAQELMREYSVTIDPAELLNLGHAEVNTGSLGKTAPSHETRLINAIARAFGCRCAYGTRSGNYWRKSHEFIGPEHRVQIASYIANDWANGFVSGEKVEIQQGVGAVGGRLSIGAPL